MLVPCIGVCWTPWTNGWTPGGVELKLTVADAHHRATIVALGLDPLEAQIRRVSFFETPELALDKHGLMVRARRVKGREDDSVVKPHRLVAPDDVPERLRRSPSMVVELDAMPGAMSARTR
jgi:hypothetical protein